MSSGQTIAIFGSWVLEEKEGKASVQHDRWVLIEGNKFAAVVLERPIADVVLDRPGRFVLPGFHNLHNHVFSESIARTHSEDGAGGRDIGQFIHDVLLPLSNKGIVILSPEERLAVARLGILQLMKGGATSVLEPCRDTMPEMFTAAEEMGLRFYGAPYLFSNSDNPEHDLKNWNMLYQRWNGVASDRIRVLMSPHATDTCNSDLLKAASARARELRMPLTLHVAQTEQELKAIANRADGRTPAEYLDWLGVLGPEVLAAHCVYSTDKDLKLMADRGVSVINCPRTFARAGITASYARFAENNIRTLIGTDGFNMDLIGEIGVAAIVSKTTSARADVAKAPDLIGAVTHHGAMALGREDLGAIRPGAIADLTVLDLSHPHLQPLQDPLRAVVSLGSRADVDGIVVDGKLLIDEGKLLAGSESDIVSAGAAAVEKIWDLPEARALLTH